MNSEVMNLERLIDIFKKRPVIFFRTVNATTVEAVNHFLLGFICAKAAFAELEPFEDAFDMKFTEYIYEKYSVIITSYLPSWYAVIREHTTDEKDALNKFFGLYDEFREKFYSNTLVFED